MVRYPLPRLFFSSLGIFKTVDFKSLLSSVLGLSQGLFLFIFLFFYKWVVLSLHAPKFLLKTEHFEDFNVATLQIIFFTLLRVCFCYLLYSTAACFLVTFLKNICKVSSCVAYEGSVTVAYMYLVF